MVDFLLRLLLEVTIVDLWPPRWQKFGEWWKERTLTEKFRILLAWSFLSSTIIGAVLLALFGMLSLVAWWSEGSWNGNA